MKKKGNIIVIIIVIIIIAIIGYIYTSQKNLEEKMINQMDIASKDYFKNYISTNTSNSEYEVTLKMLEDAKEENNYDLSSLDSCSKEKTKAYVKVNFSNGEAKGTEVVLDCKKLLKLPN